MMEVNTATKKYCARCGGTGMMQSMGYFKTMPCTCSFEMREDGPSIRIIDSKRALGIISALVWHAEKTGDPISEQADHLLRKAICSMPPEQVSVLAVPVEEDGPCPTYLIVATGSDDAISLTVAWLHEDDIEREKREEGTSLELASTTTLYFEGRPVSFDGVTGKAKQIITAVLSAEDEA